MSSLTYSMYRVGILVHGGWRRKSAAHWSGLESSALIMSVYYTIHYVSVSLLDEVHMERRNQQAIRVISCGWWLRLYCGSIQYRIRSVTRHLKIIVLLLWSPAARLGNRCFDLKKRSIRSKKTHFTYAFDSFPPFYAKRSNHSRRSSIFDLF